MGKRVWWAVSALVVVAAGAAAVLGLRGPGGMGASAKPADASASAPLQFRANEVVRPELVALPQVLEFSGPLVAPDSAVLRARASGTLASLTVAEGDRVRAGQQVGRIDVSELGARIAERQAQLEAARATLTQAQRTHQSNEGLAAQQFISPVALEGSKSTLDAARAQLGAAQAAVDTLRAVQRDAQLAAPIDGIVARRQALPGERVALDQPVLSIVDLRRLELAASVGTHEVGLLAPGMPVQVRVEGRPEPVAARVSRIAPAAEPGTRSIGVTVALPNADERMRAGQYAVARLELPDARQRLVLPGSAVGSTGGQAHVWMVQDGKLLRRAVTLGRRDEAHGRVEVLTGLAPGATVLGARFDNLREGMPVVVAAASPGAAAVASAAPASAANAAR